MTYLYPVSRSQTSSTALAGGLAAALAILPAQFALGADHNQPNVVSENVQEIEIVYNQVGSSQTSLKAEFDDLSLDRELATQMEELFARLIESQTAVEPEFYSALYKNRSEMYTLF